MYTDYMKSHPTIPNFVYDARTIQEVEKTRDLDRNGARRLSKRARRAKFAAVKQMGPDLDGAFRYANRLDEQIAKVAA